MMLVRPYTPADREACLRVFDSNVPKYFAAAEREDYQAFLNDLPGPYLVITDEASVVLACGGYAVEPAERRADLCWGMVRQGHHREGIGTLLLRERLTRVREEPGVDAVHLDTGQHTRIYYERAGFRVLREIRDGYVPGYHRYDMRLEWANTP